MKKNATYQDHCPIWVHAFHFVRLNPIMSTFIKLCKPFMKREVMEKVHLHKTVEDLHE